MLRKILIGAFLIDLIYVFVIDLICVFVIDLIYIFVIKYLRFVFVLVFVFVHIFIHSVGKCVRSYLSRNHFAVVTREVI